MFSINNPQYTLYYSPISIRSLQIWYMLLLKGEPKDDTTSLDVELKHIDIFAGETLSEHYLCNINPEGYVPVLTQNIANSRPLCGTVNISHFIASRYPSLLPKAHGSQITGLMQALHDINFFSLSFGARGPPHGEKLVAQVEGMLAQAENEGNGRYCDALRKKLASRKAKVDDLSPNAIDVAKVLTREFFTKIESLLQDESSGAWIFGDVPTMLDAHVVVFIQRLQDIDCAELIPGKVSKYGDVAMERREWKEMMQDRGTMGKKSRL